MPRVMVNRLHFAGKQRLAVGIAVSVYLALGLAYGLVIPPFENLDEIEHFGVIHYIVDYEQLPVHGMPEEEIYHYRQEASQPPLYHLLSAGVAHLLDLSFRDDLLPRRNPWVACGPEAASPYDNRTVLYHNPNREAFPWHDALLTLHILRIWSTLLQLTTVLGTYALARLVFPRHRAASLIAMAVVAFNPQFLLVASDVNNDNLLIPLATIGLYVLFHIWKNGPSTGRSVGLGLLIGLAGLTKLSGWFLLPLSAIVVLIRVYHPLADRKLVNRSLLRFAGHLMLIISPALAVSGWWFWRNWQLYGDLVALQPMLDIVGVRDGSLSQSFFELGTMFRSFWGQIPCAFYPSGFYAFYAGLTAIAVGGLCWHWRQLTSSERGATIILGAWFLLIVASWMHWNATTAAPGGRLLFPALPAVGLLMALGINSLTQGQLEPGRWIVIGALVFTACWTGLRILPAFFAPPPRYSNAEAIEPEHPIEATIGQGIRLLGYDVELNDQTLTLDTTLYWQALDSMTEDYVLALQLVSPVPEDNTLRWNYNSWTGRGTYPTSAWQPSEVIVDSYHFRLLKADFPTQAWDLHLALFQKETGDRLPVRVRETNVGNRLILNKLRVPGVKPACPKDGQLTHPVHFGEAIALTHANVVPGPEHKSLSVTLCWESLKTLSIDYTVFVHLEDGDTSDTPVATGDGPPMEGAFPTSMWRPGDVILDIHQLPMGSRSRPHDGRITIGLYNSEDGSRLPAFVDGILPVPNAAVPIWPSRP